MERLLERDHTLWKEDPREISNRLGWLDSPDTMRDHTGRILSTARSVRDEGHRDVLLLGMGGSSLAPDLFGRTFDPAAGYPDLRVLDSTDPAAVGNIRSRLDPSTTLYVVSTKSGTTPETISFLKFFYNEAVRSLGDEGAGRHFVAVTDPGSPLEALAAELGFRETFCNDPDIGGRYSALSFFGLLPAALMGVDIERLLDRAAAMARSCTAGGGGDGSRHGTAAVLGAFMGSLHNVGVNKVTFITSPSVAPLGAWLEQLIAESTGKEGRGIVPVDGENPGRPYVYGKDRLFVHISISGDTTHNAAVKALLDAGHPVVRIQLSDLYDLGGEFFRWEAATAVAGHVMGINPFDQPDVESAKVQARTMLERYREQGELPQERPALSEGTVDVFTQTPAENLDQALQRFLSLAVTGDYAALQAYVDPTEEATLALQELRHGIRDRLRVATTLGFGPRFLHSTGQLHKGDGGRGLFIQVTAQDARDLPIPDEPGSDDSSITFGILKAAQAMGDLQALREGGRRVIRFHIRGDVPEGIRRLTEGLKRGD